MKMRSFLRASLVLNLVLFVALAVTFRSRPQGLWAGSEGRAGAEVESTDRGDAQASEAGARSSPVERGAWSWSQLTMDPLPAYRDGLRAIGCPDASIREILEPIVFRQIRERCRREVTPLSVSFWERLAGGINKTTKEVQSIAEHLKQDHERALGDLLGALSAGSSAEASNGDPVTQFLPAETQSAVHAAQTRYQLRLLNWYSSPESQGTNRVAGAASLEAEHKEEMENLLSADQTAEYRRRSSNHASLRMLEGIELSESDVKSVVELLDRTENGSDDARETELKALLGEDRAKELERAQDANYQMLHELGRRAGIPRENTAALWEAQQSAEIAARGLASNSSQTIADREAAMSALRESIEASAEKLLGERGMSAWRQMRLNWLKGTFQVPPIDPLAGLPPVP